MSVDPSPYWSFFLWQFGPSRVTDNVRRVINFYQPHGLIGRSRWTDHIPKHDATG